MYQINCTIKTLTVSDIDAVDDLMKRNSATLGFLPKEALSDYLKQGNVLGAMDANSQLVGYILYGSTRSYFRVAHLCVSAQIRGKGIARQLFDALKEKRTTQRHIRLSCRRDFPAHNLWHKLGFVPIGEKPGRSVEGHLLTRWHYSFSQGAQQLKLSQDRISDDAIDVVMDAQIFFDLYEADSDKSIPAKALRSDFLLDSLNLHITDELLVEINRKENLECRRVSRERTENFLEVNTDKERAEEFENLLKEVLRSDTPSDESDIRHLAKTAASDVNIFVTRDAALLKKAEEIYTITNLRILSPERLITQVHEISDSKSYIPVRVSGFNVEWRRLTSEDIKSFPYDSFLIARERKGKLKERLSPFFAHPELYQCELLWSKNEPVSFRVLENNGNESLVIHFTRVAPSKDRSLFERFAIADTIYKAVAETVPMVECKVSAIAPKLQATLLEMGFSKTGDSFMRFCFSMCKSQEEILCEIANLSLDSLPAYQDMVELKLERNCSPLSTAANQEYFLVPIKANYAMSLVDRYQSATDMFGGNVSVLLSWDNVYYRTKSHHNMLKAPARVLWYVSGANQKKSRSYITPR